MLGLENRNVFGEKKSPSGTLDMISKGSVSSSDEVDWCEALNCWTVNT